MNPNRRALLRALGLGVVAAPWVPLLPSHAHGDSIPRRLLIVHFAHGVARDRWSPVEDAGSLTLSPILAPLEDFASRITVVEGLDNPVGRAQVGDVHNIATGTVLTCMPLSADLGAGGHYLPGGISIDQRLAPELNRDDAVPFASVQLGVRSQGFALASRSVDQPLRAEDDPVAAHGRLFGELARPSTERGHRAEQRRRARDFVRRRLDALDQLAPHDDRQVLHAHREAVETLQDRLDTMPSAPPECSVPEVSPPIDQPMTPADVDVPRILRLQTELAVAALGCDLTRVMTLQWGSSGNDGLRHVWQDIDDEFHSLAHLANGEDAHAHEQLARMNTWTMEQLAHLLGRLDAVPQGDGTLLDYTVVVCLSSLSVGHHMGDLPVVIAGGGLTGGRHRIHPEMPISALWTSLAQHLGVSMTGFGDPDHDHGVLPQL